MDFNPFSDHLQSPIVKIKHELKLVDLYEAKGAYSKAHLYWLKIGETVTKEFFQRLYPSKKATQFNSIVDDGFQLTFHLRLLHPYQPLYTSLCNSSINLW